MEARRPGRRLLVALTPRKQDDVLGQAGGGGVGESWPFGDITGFAGELAVGC